VSDHYRAAVRALTALTRETEHDFPGVIARTLAQVAGNLGSSDALTESRPGSWEASFIDQLVKGTVGYDDEYLPPPDHGKLTDAKARLIKDAARFEDMTQREIAAKFGVSPSTVSDINTGKTWSWLS
jgi:hypothetical protein